jgi:hypothetical protein
MNAEARAKLIETVVETRSTAMEEVDMRSMRTSAIVMKTLSTSRDKWTRGDYGGGV